MKPKTYFLIIVPAMFLITAWLVYDESLISVLAGTATIMLYISLIEVLKNDDKNKPE